MHWQDLFFKYRHQLPMFKPIRKFSQDEMNLFVVTSASQTPAIYPGNDLHFVAPRLWAPATQTGLTQILTATPPGAETQQCTRANRGVLKGGTEEGQ